MAADAAAARPVRLGLAENWRQFSLLVLINAFVGSMVGLERTVVPLIGSETFRLSSAAVSDVAHPNRRARSLSAYRSWRDMGYAIGALVGGIIADAFGLAWAIVAIGGFTVLSGAVVALVTPARPPHGAAGEKPRPTG